MKLDPIRMEDWQIAEAAEANIQPIEQVAEKLGLQEGELRPKGGNVAKVDFRKTWDRVQHLPRGKYVDVTAITPTPLGEGKTTTPMGLVEGLGRIGKKPVGAIELAEAVVSACEAEHRFDYLYALSLPLKDRVEKIAVEIYGAEGVEWSEKAEAKINRMQDDPEAAQMDMCMVKTHLSPSHDPNLKGAPTGWILPIRDVLIYKGAGFVVPVAGDIKLLPGTGSNPGFRRIDVDVDTGKVTGLFQYMSHTKTQSHEDRFIVALCLCGFV